MDAEQRRSVAAKIRDARNNRGWSQARLAEQAGVSERTVFSAERGEHVTQERKLRMILNALDLVPDVAVLSLDGIPEDVETFIRIITAKLAALPEAERRALIGDLLLLGLRDNGYAQD